MRYFAFVLLLVACGEDEPICNSGFTVFEETLQASQCGTASGTVTLTTLGGRGNESITYRIDNESPQTSATFTDLLPGNYKITAQDEAGCTASITISIPKAEPQWTIRAEATSAACGRAIGSIRVQADGGRAPYQYSLDNITFSSATTFDNLLPGKYAVVVQDANGCTTTTNARVTSGVSFKTDVHDIITTNCAIAGCHVSGRAADFTVRDNIFKYAESIRERTGDRSMPLGRELTDEEIARIDCWVNDGAPDN